VVGGGVVGFVFVVSVWVFFWCGLWCFGWRRGERSGFFFFGGGSGGFLWLSCGLGGRGVVSFLVVQFLCWDWGGSVGGGGVGWWSLFFFFRGVSGGRTFVVVLGVLRWEVGVFFLLCFWFGVFL